MISLRLACCGLALLLTACGTPESISIYGDGKSPAAVYHSVVAGDSVHSIAQRYSVSRRALIVANRLEPPYRLRAGMRLAIPEPNFHRVVRGDTVSEIAEQYGVRMQALIRLNNLAPPYLIRTGEKLRLPSVIEPLVASRVPAKTGGSTPKGLLATKPKTPAKTLPKTSKAQPGAQPGSAKSSTHQATPRPKPSASKAKLGAKLGVKPSAKPSLTSQRPARGGRFIWPVEGKVISGFGVKGSGIRNDGVNLSARRGTRVRAAQGGTVAYAGNELRGFGNIVLLKHADDFMTVYAHNEKNLVRDGDKVRQGQPIALVGSSGSAAKPQLHFEIRKKQKAMNPLRLLGRSS